MQSAPKAKRSTHAGRSDATRIEAYRLVLDGHVQGVGFRPFIYRLAQRYALRGWVQNQLGRVEAFVQGSPKALRAFLHDVIAEAPPLSCPNLASRKRIEPESHRDFQIIPSTNRSEARIFVPPDYYTCKDCLRELMDFHDRRFRYPFINCTQCGPRYTLIERMPYDRPNTTMAAFMLCAQCRREYEDPNDRRFHAEPIACPTCGPQLEFRRADAKILGNTAGALTTAISALSAGDIIAVKGLGGYHLMCDARNEKSVSRLRERKRRPDKPLAVMFPVCGPDGLSAVKKEVRVTAEEAALMVSPMRPIILAESKPDSTLAAAIAPGLSEIGVFLPYSPLHHLLLEGGPGPLVATSGNISGEPVLTDAREAQSRLTSIADGFLHHDRRIARPADDPVYRLVAGAVRPLRLGRGAAPCEFHSPPGVPHPILAVGAHMKNTISLAWQDRIVVSPHIGEMGSPRSLNIFEKTVEDLQALYGVRAETLVCDAHPGYTTTRWAKQQGLPVTAVFHHHAHASALAAEHGGSEDWLIFTWDGVGLGEDGALWGGEALLGAPGRWRRVGSMRPFHLPGGDKVGREPWRSAAALCWEASLSWQDIPYHDPLFFEAWQRRLNCPKTTAVGRLFDAAAALVLKLHQVTYEAQAPMILEAICRDRGEPVSLPMEKTQAGFWQTDWAPLLPILQDGRLAPTERAMSFHLSMAYALLAQAIQVRSEYGVSRVGLCGGVFQNRVLTERATELLRASEFEVALASRVPINDAGISYGQAIEYAAASRLKTPGAGKG